MKKILVFKILVFLSINSYADVTCKGRIKSIYKWNNFETISVMLDSANRWISMPTKSDESMALLAFASDKRVEFRWEDDNVTSCTNGWSHNKVFNGWWLVEKN